MVVAKKYAIFFIHIPYNSYESKTRPFASDTSSFPPPAFNSLPPAPLPLRFIPSWAQRDGYRPLGRIAHKHTARSQLARYHFLTKQNSTANEPQGNFPNSLAAAPVFRGSRNANSQPQIGRPSVTGSQTPSKEEGSRRESEESGGQRIKDQLCCKIP